MSLPKAGVRTKAGSSTNRRIAAREVRKSDPLLQITNLLVDPDDDVADACDRTFTPKPARPKPKPKPVATKTQFMAAVEAVHDNAPDDDEQDDADDHNPDDEDDEVADSDDVLKKLDWYGHTTLVDALAKVRAAGAKAWPFLCEVTDRVVLCLKEVIRREGNAALHLACEAYIAARRSHLVGDDIRNCWDSDYLNNIEDAEDEDEDTKYTDAYVAEYVTAHADDNADELLTTGPKAKRSGKPKGVGPKRTAAEKTEERPSKKVDVAKLAAEIGKRVEPSPNIHTRKWMGTMAGGQPEWVRCVVAAATKTKVVGNLQQVLTQMSYWAKPQADGQPRAHLRFRVTHDGVWWFAISPTEMGKSLKWPPRTVKSAFDALVFSGLMERRVEAGKYGPNTSYIRIRWEVIHYMLSKSKVMEPHRPRPSGKKKSEKGE